MFLMICYLTVLVKKTNYFVFVGTLIVLVGVVGRTEQFYCLKSWHVQILAITQ
jgi:hypothetical protein